MAVQRHQVRLSQRASQVDAFERLDRQIDLPLIDKDRQVSHYAAGHLGDDLDAGIVADGKVQADAACCRPAHLSDRHLEHDLLLARNAEQVDDVRFARSDVVFQRVWRPVVGTDEGVQVQVDRAAGRNIGFGVAVAARGVGTNNVEDLDGLHSVFGLAAHHQLVADQEKVHVIIGKSAVDLVFERLVGPFEPLLGLGVGQYMHHPANNRLLADVVSVAEPHGHDRTADLEPLQQDLGGGPDDRVGHDPLVRDLDAEGGLDQVHEPRSANDKIEVILGIIERLHVAFEPIDLFRSWRRRRAERSQHTGGQAFHAWPAGRRGRRRIHTPGRRHNVRRLLRTGGGRAGRVLCDQVGHCRRRNWEIGGRLSAG